MSDQSIWKSVQNLMDIETNLSNLCLEFDTIVADAPKWSIERDSDHTTKLDWCNPVYEIYYSIFTKHPRRKVKFEAAGWITIAVQLTCDLDEDGPDWEHGQRAKVLVGYAKEDNWTFHTQHPSASGLSEDCIINGSHWVYSESPDWFYALPLDALTSREQVKKLIIDPLHQVVQGADYKEVLSQIETALCLPPAQ